ncbi:hypothetical protein DOE76_11420 [Leifsonia sp. ku-ls]|nr:hypothetical protein DOE76_11420 [Leifsonia sp. ku-ls]
MTSQNHPYVPNVGAPTIVFLTALAIATALPTAFLLHDTTPPLWVTAATFAVLLPAAAAVPAMNARTRPAARRDRSLNLTALVGAIVVPALLLVPVAAVPGLGWLMAVAVGVQVALLLLTGLLAARRPRP